MALDLSSLKPFDAGQFIQFGEAGQKQRTLADLGQRAAKGDYAGAASAAFAGGQPDIGAALAKMSNEQHAQLVQDAASGAYAATTPDAWQAFKTQFESTHPGFEVPPFAARQAVISQAQTVQQQIENAQKNRELATNEQKVSQAGGTSLSPEALDLLSTQYLAGDKSAVVGFARSPTMRAQLTNAIAAKAAQMGRDGRQVAAEFAAYAGNVAGQRAAGTRAAQVGMAASEANQMADIALEASNKVPRGSFVPWNEATNAVRTKTSSPEMAAFVTATTSLVNAYARAISPLGAPTDAMRQHAEAMLNTAQSPEAYSAVIAQMKREMDAALNAPAEISANLKAGVADGGGGGEQTSTSAQPGAPTDQGWIDLGNGVRIRQVQ